MTDEYRSRIYEKYAANFQDAAGVFDEAAAAAWGKAYRSYLKGWLPADREAAVVDVACGGGKLLFFFKQMGYSKVSGVEISPDQAALARQVLPDVAQQDVLAFLEQHSTQFELITGLDVIEHLHKAEVLRFLDGCYSALKPGGRIILQTPNADSPWGASLRYGDFTHEVGFTPDSLARLLRLSGFQGVEAREVGPVCFGYSAISTMRYFVWRVIQSMLKIWNVAETGSAGSGVFTRVFLIAGKKQ